MLRISAELELPVDVAGEAIGILAKRGAGKTNTAVVLVEEMVAAGVQVVVLDPVGVWWGVRAGFDGSRKGGLPMPVLGGEHGDVALEPSAGQLIADVVVDSGQSIVIDLSEFSKTDQRTFVAAFATRLYTRKAKARTLLHVVLEEADEFAPQRVMNRDAPMVGAIAQLVKRGRSRGLGLTFVTQRSASLNKDVLDQADVLIAMRTGGPRDRKAIEGWIEHQDAAGVNDVLPSLPGLDTGQAWIWNPERSLLQLVMIRRRRTFDSSKTPEVCKAGVEPKETATIDLGGLGQRIAETAERAKANDPAELRRHIRELEGKASNLEGKINVLERATAREPEDRLVVETIKVRVEVPALTDEERQLLDGVANAIEHAAVASEELLEQLETITKRLQEEPCPAASSSPRPGARTSGGGSSRSQGGSVAAAPAAPARPPVVATRGARTAPSTSTAEGVSGPQQRILNALAALENIGVQAPVKVQLALFAEASPKSSSFTNNLGHLNNHLGLISYPKPGRVELTDAGRVIADAGVALSTADELHTYVYGLVGAPKTRLLEHLIGRYPDALSKAELAELAGASASSSSFTNNLGALRSLGLIDYPEPGFVTALEVLFP